MRAARVGDHAKHGSLPEGRDGAGDESTRSDFAGDGEEDHVGASGGDYRAVRTASIAALAAALGGAGNTTGCWTGGGESRAPKRVPLAQAEEVLAVISGEVCGPERTALS